MSECLVGRFRYAADGAWVRFELIPPDCIGRPVMRGLEPADVLRKPVDQHLGNATTSGQCAGLVHHVGEVLRTHSQFLVPFERADARCRRLEAGV